MLDNTGFFALIDLDISLPDFLSLCAIMSGFESIIPSQVFEGDVRMATCVKREN
jgi:hypothetical protein